MDQDDGIDEIDEIDEGRDRSADAALVAAALAGDPEAFGALYDRWFERVHHLVSGIVREHHSAQDVCQDAFLAAWRGLPRLEDHRAFGGWLLRIARNTAYDRARVAGRSRPVDGEALEVIERTTTSAAPAGLSAESRLARAEDPELAATDGEIAALVREAVAALGERDAEVLDLQLRFGLSPAEVGAVVGINRNAANQLCHRVRKRFATAFGARMLFSADRPGCALLAAELRDAGVVGFGAGAVRIADDHVDRCAACDERRKTRLLPAQLFAAIPLLPVAAAVRAEVASALAAAGVPMGSAAGSTGSAVAAATDPAHAGHASGEAAAGGGTRSEPDADAPPGNRSEAARTAASAGDVAPPGSARRMPVPTAALVAAAVIAVLLLAGVLVVVVDRSSGGPDESVALEAAARAAPAPDTDAPPPTAAAPPSTEVTGPDPSTTTGSQVAPDPGTTPASDPGQVSTAPASSTSTSPPPLPPPVVEHLDLVPDEPRGVRYVIGRSSPVLIWAVADAAQVEVWLLRERADGTEERIRAIASDPQGSIDVCPGTVEGNECASTPGTYAFEVVASSGDGQVVRTPSSERPRLVILEPVIP